ncbi:hypothetical protein [Acidovorax carolinensis]|nr:hypothetical protein [Acidovorax carolinensis]
MNEKESRKVALSSTTLTFALPDDFGRGWDYTRVVLHAASHAWAGSYDRSVNENFAHEALQRVTGIDGSSLYVGMNCTATFQVNSISEASAIQSRLQEIVDAFPPRDNRDITVRGSNYFDSVVTEYDAAGEETGCIPFRAYLATRVPLATTTHPALAGEDIPALLAELGNTAKKRVKSASPRPRM